MPFVCAVFVNILFIWNSTKKLVCTVFPRIVFRGNYSFLNLALFTVTFDLYFINLNSCRGNYSREETIQGRKLFAEIRYAQCSCTVSFWIIEALSANFWKQKVFGILMIVRTEEIICKLYLQDIIQENSRVKTVRSIYCPQLNMAILIIKFCSVLVILQT